MSADFPVARRVGNALLVGIFLFLSCMPHNGMLALVLLPFFACSWLYDFFVMARKPEQRVRRTERVITWMLAFCVTGAVNYYWFRASRADANNIADAVMSYRARTGVYPTDLLQTGVHPERAFRKWMLVYAVGSDGKPLLAYSVPWDGLDTYDYDFDTGKWVYWTD